MAVFERDGRSAIYRIFSKLLQEKGDSGLFALGVDVASPFKIERLGVRSALTSCDDPVDSRQRDLHRFPERLDGQPAEPALHLLQLLHPRDRLW